MRGRGEGGERRHSGVHRVSRAQQVKRSGDDTCIDFSVATWLV